MMNYDDINDEQLIERYRSGEHEVVDYLLGKYKTLVRIKANSLFLLGGETDDLIQEGMIGLFKAINEYKADGGSSFKSFADVCISRQMYTAIEAAARKKHIPLNNYVPLSGESDDVKTISTSDISGNDQINPEQIVIDRENLNDLWKKIHSLLSNMEKDVMELSLQGLNYHQIAEELGKPDKSIDNALQRIRNKISRNLS